jgi:actin-related protein 9
MTDGPAPTDNPTVVSNGTNGVGNEANRPQHIEYEEYLEEDPDSDEGAEWPIEQGVIVNMPCFLALMQHVWRLLNPPFHSPAIVIAQPVWSMRDYEQITRLAFQNWNVPALHITDSGLMGLYGVGLESGLTVDIGYDKADITPVLQSNIDQMARRFSLKGCGGNSMTKILQQRLKNQGFDEDMAEQLKKSNICEILPIGTSLPSSEVKVSNPAAAASTGATASGDNAREADGMRPGQTPRGPGAGTEVGEGDDDDNEGVLDVASIVARDNAAELLAKREQEKAAKAAAKKGGVQDAPKQARLKNSEKENATFTYKESITDNGSIENLDGKSRLRKREIEVGIERFMAAESTNDEDMGILETIAWNIYNTIMAVQNISARPMLWDNILVCGNGSRIKGKLINHSRRSGLIWGLGFKEALMALLISKYKLSPSTATIFTSELPSNFTTPVATPGTNTPIPGQASHLHHSAGHAANRSLLALATHNALQPGQAQRLQIPGHATPVVDHGVREGRVTSQAPASIKYCKLPEYMPDWKDAQWSNFEEASFGGAQVLANLIFQNSKDAQEGWFLTRAEFNDEGPGAIAQYCMF